jgi:large subunit ribosomal protein L4
VVESYFAKKVMVLVEQDRSKVPQRDMEVSHLVHKIPQIEPKKCLSKMRKLALKWVSNTQSERQWISLTITIFPMTLTSKTKNAYQTVLKNLKLEHTRKTLVVIPEKTDILVKSFKNLPNAKYLLANYLNPVDLLSYKNVIIMNGSLQKMSEWLNW